MTNNPIALPGKIIEPPTEKQNDPTNAEQYNWNMTSTSIPATIINRVGSQTISYFFHPLQIFKTYQLENLRPDLLAGLTVAVVLLPQAIAFALIAELPPAVGLYAAIVTAIVGALLIPHLCWC